MTKITAIASEPTLTPSQESILKFLMAHPYEVFTLTEAKEVAPSLGLSKNNATWCLWAMEKRKLIRKRRLGRNVYYGSPEAIEHLNRELTKKGRR